MKISSTPSVRHAGLLLLICGAGLVTIGAFWASPGFFAESRTLFLSLLKGLPGDPAWFGQLNRYAWEGMFRGVLLLISGLLILFRYDSFSQLANRRKLWLSFLALLLLTLWGPVTLLAHTTTIGDERFWWLFDDGMISMRYAHNLASGLGLVWNEGERVEGFTNFLWVMYMSLIHVFPLPLSKTSFVILVTNLGISMATVPVLARLTTELGGRPLAVGVTACAFVLSKNSMYWSAEGSETALLTFMLLLIILRVVQEAKQSEPKLSTYLLIGVTGLIRADSIVLCGMVYMLSLVLNRSTGKVIRYSLISLVIPALFLLFRIVYYGDILPNTAYLKVFNWHDRYIAGIHYIAAFGVRYGPVLILAVLGLILSSDNTRRYLFALFVFYSLYLAYVGGDAFQDFRFFVPVIPVLLALAFLTIQDIGVSQPYRFAVSVLALVTIPLVFSPSYMVYLRPLELNVLFVRRGVLINRNTSPSAKVASTGVGSIFYFADRRGVDLLGKVDRHVARLEVVRSNAKPGHNKIDLDYSLGKLRPDIVICHVNFPVNEEAIRRNAVTGIMPADSMLYLHPLFRKHCLPYPVSADPSRTVYVCDWSSELLNKDSWTELPPSR